jgi:hypothetical protein
VIGTVLAAITAFEAQGGWFLIERDVIEFRYPLERDQRLRQVLATLHAHRDMLLKLLGWRLRGGDIEFAAKICAHLEASPVGESPTASDLAEAFYGPDYTLDEALKINRVLIEFLDLGFLVSGEHGFGVQITPALRPGPLPEEVLGVPAPPECPTLPKGVRLIRYAPKSPPVEVPPCSIVFDVEKFIRRNLEELDARLNSPIQIRAGGSVLRILGNLKEVGLEVAIENHAITEP